MIKQSLSNTSVASVLVKKGVSALVYTQLSDVEDETNGFLTYDRRVVKADLEALLNLSIKLKEAIK